MRKPFFQFLLLTAAAWLLSGALSALTAKLIWGYPMCFNEPAAQLYIQTLTSIVTFLLPALWLNRRLEAVRPDFLSARKGFKISRLLVCLAVFALLVPALEGLEGWAENWHLEQSPYALLRRLHERVEMSEAIIENIIRVDNKAVFVWALIVICPLAGICEEFSFRGSLQNLFREMTGNPHAAVWITAVVFSAAHIDPYGFLPRLILGAFLGYAYIYGGSIWVPAILHTLNNLLTLLILLW